MKSIRVIRLHTAPSSRHWGHSFEAMVMQAPHPAESPKPSSGVKLRTTDWNISSAVILYFDLDTSGGYDESWVCEFVEGKSRPLRCLHQHQVTRGSTVS